MPTEVEILILKAANPATLAKFRRVNKACLALVDEIVDDKLALLMAEAYLKDCNNLEDSQWNLSYSRIPDRQKNLQDAWWVARYTNTAVEDWQELNTCAYVGLPWLLFGLMDDMARRIEEDLDVAKGWWLFYNDQKLWEIV